MRSIGGEAKAIIPAEIYHTLRLCLKAVKDAGLWGKERMEGIDEATNWLDNPTFTVELRSPFPLESEDDVIRPSAFGRHQLDEFYLDASKEPPVGHKIVVQIICPHQDGLVDSYRGMKIISSKNELLHTEIGADPYEVVVNCRRWAWTHDYGWETHVSVGLFLELYEKSKDDIVF